MPYAKPPRQYCAQLRDLTSMAQLNTRRLAVLQRQAERRFRAAGLANGWLDKWLTEFSNLTLENQCAIGMLDEQLKVYWMDPED
jgi:hypothetical protein